jgi:hypothetical protein
MTHGGQLSSRQDPASHAWSETVIPPDKPGPEAPCVIRAQAIDPKQSLS